MPRLAFAPRPAAAAVTVAGAALRVALVALPALALAACDDAAATTDPANRSPGCQPLAVGDCALPWPSSFYLAADSSTVTGYRVSVPDGVLPKDQIGHAMDPARLNRLDGFSPATPILVNLKARVDPKQLPPYDDLTASLRPESTVQLVRMDTLERVPLFAEVDKNVVDACKSDADCHTGTCSAGACTPASDQLLIIRPMVRLRPATRYLVVLRDLVDVDGKRIVNPAFDALNVDSVDGSPSLRALRPRYHDELYPTVLALGIRRGALTLLWDFRTGSDAQLTSHLVSMRDDAFRRWETDKLGYHFDSVTEPADDHLLRKLVGTFDVPSYLTGEKLSDGLELDGKFMPVYRGTSSFPLVVHVPKCARTATKPLPFLVFGHGLFGTADGEMSSGYQKSVSDRLCMIEIGTDWIGLSNIDSVEIAAQVISNFSNFYIPTDRLQQAQLNFLVLAHLAATKLAADPALSLGGKPIADGKEVYYYGISQGGIEGNTFLSLSPDVDRGVLNVGAGEYSLMLTRSADFRTFKGIMDNVYPSQRDQQLLLAVSQSYWDFSDPITFVPYSIKAPIAGLDGKPLPPRHLLQQEGIGDGQVPNMATRVLVRTAGLTLLDPPVQAVYGVPVAAGPLDSAYTQWDVMPSPLPGPYNVLPEDNQAHEAVRRLDRCIEQIGRFLRPGGKVEQTCDGKCVFPRP